jgi:hypothetical protein
MKPDELEPIQLERQPKKKKTNDKSDNERITISLPKGMGQLVDLIAKASDLDASKLMRAGLDSYVIANEARLPKPVLDHYWKFRNRYRGA